MSQIDQQSHEHNSEETFNQLLEQAKQSQKSTTTSEYPLSDMQLTDNYFVAEQKERSRVISSILQHYENSYKNKVVFQQQCRKILFWGCSGIVILFSAATLLALYYTIKNIASLDVSGMATIITVIVSFVGTIIGLVHTITKYCFPENDEEYIVKIVESIQSNDLERTREINRVAESRKKQNDTTAD